MFERKNIRICEPFEIPDNWERFMGVDRVNGKIYGCVWAAKEPATGHIYIYRELRLGYPPGPNNDATEEADDRITINKYKRRKSDRT